MKVDKTKETTNEKRRENVRYKFLMNFDFSYVKLLKINQLTELIE